MGTAPLAQLVERVTSNDKVCGSNPQWSSVLFRPVVRISRFHRGDTGSIPVGGANLS